MPDKNGFVRRGERVCPDCGYDKHNNGRLRRTRICAACRKAKPKFEGTWSEDVTRPVGTTEVH